MSRLTAAAVRLVLIASLLGVPVTATADDKPAITFLSGDAARAAIVDESVEPYFKLLQPIEMVAKTGGAALTATTLDAQREETRRRYRSDVADFTPEEQAQLRGFVERIYPTLAKGYPKFAAEPWSFIKITRVEGNLPHTRGHSIVLSSAFIAHLPKPQKQPNPLDLPRAASILVHEQAHVFERTHPKLMPSLYTEVFGFLRATNIKSDPTLDARQIVNPDGVDLGWVKPVEKNGATRYLWPRVLFGGESPTPRMPFDFQMVAVELEKTPEGFAVKFADGKPVTTPLQSERGYGDKLPPSNSIYHPNEIAADAFAMVIVLDLMPNDPNPPAPESLEHMKAQLAPSREWFTKNFAADAK
jgi:hypothetical protein